MVVYLDMNDIKFDMTNDEVYEFVMPSVDRYAGGEPLAFSHIGIPNLIFEEKEEGRFYYVEEDTTL